MDKEHPIQMLPGIGPNRAARLQKLGIETADDLLRWFPRQYEDRRTVYPVEGAPVGEKCCVSAVVVETPRTSRITKGREVTRLRAADDTGVLNITFFGQSYVRTALQVGQSYVFYGTIEGTQRRKGMTNPIFGPEHRRQDTGRIMPIYPLTAGISNHLLASAVAWCLEQPWAEWPEDLPQTIRQRYQLATRTYAVRIAHFPPSWEELAIARRRLVFEELFYFSIGLALLRQRRTEEEGIRCASGDLRDFYALLPFQLTGAQRRAAEDAARDLTRGVPMNRLLQGDVGSGKTILAFLALLMCAANGRQGCLMAPTEVLARQHYEALLQMSGEYDLCIRPVLLTGSQTAKEKREIYARIADGDANVIIGTHALIQEKVIYRQLSLVITDEQHRFGVRQRELLADKGKGTHVLVMSATPIPRTLAIVVYGDLHVSVLDEMPAGRKPIKNCVVNTSYRQTAYSFIRKQAEEGHQVYVICPMVEEGEMDGLENVMDYTDKLKAVLPDSIRVAALHGKMKPAEKNNIMEAFSNKEIDVLVSTTVIEVGINVPNATVMMVENAERFGLAQLHQLRGRVGRGDSQSYCIFISGNDNEQTMKRLNILNTSNDGFHIANEDLKLRGPGDLFGIRQSGLLDFKVGDIYQDSDLLLIASSLAERIAVQDPDEKLEQYSLLYERMKQDGNSIDFKTI